MDEGKITQTTDPTPHCQMVNYTSIPLRYLFDFSPEVLTQACRAKPVPCPYPEFEVLCDPPPYANA